jgi:hypothetical protein
MSEAEREIMTIVNRNAKRGERSTLKSLLDLIARRPYGWYETGTLCILAKLFVRNKIEIKENSELLNKQQVLDHFMNSRLHSQTLLEPLPEVDARQVKALKELHRDLFNETNPGKEPKEIGMAFQNKLKEECREVQSLLRQQHRFPFLKELRPFLDQLEQLSRKNYHLYFEEWENFEDSLLDFKEDSLDPIKRFINGNQANIYEDIQLFLERGDANYRYIEVEEVAALREVIGHPHPYRGQLMQVAKEQLDRSKQQVLNAIESEKEQAAGKIAALSNKLQAYDEFGKLSPEEQERIRGYFHKAADRLRHERYIGNIRDQVRELEEVTFHRYVEEMSGLARRKEEETLLPNTGKKETLIHKSAIAKEAKISYVPLRRVQVNFKRPYLRTEEDVEEYLAKLKEAYLKLIKDKKGISL